MWLSLKVTLMVYPSMTYLMIFTARFTTAIYVMAPTDITMTLATRRKVVSSITHRVNMTVDVVSIAAPHVPPSPLRTHSLSLRKVLIPLSPARLRNMSGRRVEDGHSATC